MLLPSTASAVVIKHKPKCGNDELHGNDNGKDCDSGDAHGDNRVVNRSFEVPGLVSRLAFRFGHDSGISPAPREEAYDDDTRADKHCG
jgi:hypothetical protein